MWNIHFEFNHCEHNTALFTTVIYRSELVLFCTFCRLRGRIDVHDGPKGLRSVSPQGVHVREECVFRPTRRLEMQSKGDESYWLICECSIQTLNTSFCWRCLISFFQGSQKCRAKVITDVVNGINAIVKISDAAHNHPVRIKRKFTPRQRGANATSIGYDYIEWEAEAP